MRQPSKKNNKKLENAVHYIVSKCCNSKKLGAVKLNKILWYADARSYLKTGRPITGVSYIKKRFGPVPCDVDDAQKKLKSQGKIRVTESNPNGFRQKQFVSLKEPDVSSFNKKEIEELDETITIIRDRHTASSISKLSHDIVWKAAKTGEKIPFCAVYASRPIEITGDLLTIVDKRIAELEECSMR